MGTYPIFTDSILLGMCQATTINTARDGTGTLATLIPALANPARVDEILIKHTVTTTAGMIRIFLNDGSTTRLWAEVVVSAITVAAGTAAFSYRLINPEGSPLLLLPAGWSVLVGTEKAEACNVFASGGYYE